MKKYIVIIILAFIVTGGLVYYFASRSKGAEESAQTFLEKGDEFLEDKQYSKALEQYKLAINSDPSSTEAYLKASEIYILKLEDSSAVELLKNGETTVINPDQIHHKIGQLLLEDHDLNGALEYLEKANGENPNNWESVVDLVKVYSYFQDKKDRSVKVLGNCGTDSDEGISWKAYYLALLNYEDIDKAISYLEDIDNPHKDVKERIDNLLSVSKKVKSDPEDIVENNTLFAYELIRAELYTYSVSLLEKVVAENDEYYAAYMYMGICYMNTNDFEKATEHLQRATEIDQGQIQPWMFLAQAYTKQNNQKSAIDAFEEALNVDSSNETVRLDYARTLAGFGLYNQAKHQYQELAALENANAISYKMQVVFLDLDYLEEYEEALAMVREIVEDWDGFQSLESNIKARVLDALGWAFEKSEQKDEAIKYLKQALEIDPYLASAYYHLGVVYGEISDYANAATYLERAIDLDLSGEIGSESSTELENLKNEGKSED